MALIHPGGIMTQIEILNPVLEDEDLGVDEEEEEVERDESEDGEEK
ncbi:MAG: hypothetical protein HYS43_02005, partial [Candidatus Liptonbacteria bacterium]|nr:hypothetical protein [Candidatus Liptonbacteria bacterium]